MKLILTLSILLASVFAQNKTGELDFKKHPYDEGEYFKDIPDLVNMTDVDFKFTMVHWLLTGFERGMYNDSSIRLNDECFGPYYVTKINEYEYLFEEDPFENIL